jgi:putative PIN family toxin of toxin-antitoxin system
MKVFFDTNVIISSLVTHGHAAEVFEHCLSNHDCYASDQVLKELKEKLKDKFGYSKLEIKTALDLLRNNIKIIKDYAELPKTICRDDDDDNILAAAISGKVDCILTGDKDLLVLKNHKSINIISPKGFWILEKIFMKKN